MNILVILSDAWS